MLKILHTADWHIGKRLAGKNLLEDQAFVLEQICTYIEENDIDVVVIAGDVYDRVNPSQGAMNTVNTYLKRINLDLKVPIVMISGNHDGKPYLDGNSEWYKQTQLFVNTCLEKCFEKVRIGDVNFYLLPYIEVAEARVFYKDKNITTFEHAYERVLSDMKKDMNTDETNVLVGHLFVKNAKESDSEEKTNVGLIEEISASLLNDFDFTLLGHLHHPFAISSDTIHYSGSLLKYSFDEANQPKGFKVIDLVEKTHEFVQLESKHDVVEYHGSYKSVVEDKIDVGPEDAYYKFVLSDMESATEPMATLKKLYPNTLVLSRQIETMNYDMTMIDVSQQSDAEIFESFMEKFKGRKPTQFESEIFNHTMKEVIHETD
ncbi:exonuclease SbcCD subunit D [Phocicoccus pinnipedialis]|uniref:exonuclease SbcCD subunit D n=1 Tax=Phocicoccus pinnipedialis TaxID=110845 RepID=UPI00163F0405|nr:exonuclease SbcCD subunit D [Jeotgalicoccus pinnipedialis]MBP1939187.1 exonuclease SbcD [Jeotgalicoccus pinnipedialis]